MKRFAIALFSTLALATSAAHAIEYNQVQADKSQINFGYQQMGVSMDGAFKTFSSQLRFDPAGTLLDQAVRRRLPCQEVKK